MSIQVLTVLVSACSQGLYKMLATHSYVQRVDYFELSFCFLLSLCLPLPLIVFLFFVYVYLTVVEPIVLFISFRIQNSLHGIRARGLSILYCRQVLSAQTRLGSLDKDSQEHG